MGGASTVSDPSQELQTWQPRWSHSANLGVGVTCPLVQARATKQATSKACPTCPWGGSQMCPIGGSLLLKTQRQS